MLCAYLARPRQLCLLGPGERHERDCFLSPPALGLAMVRPDLLVSWDWGRYEPSGGVWTRHLDGEDGWRETALLTPPAREIFDTPRFLVRSGERVCTMASGTLDCADAPTDESTARGQRRVWLAGRSTMHEIELPFDGIVASEDFDYCVTRDHGLVTVGPCGPGERVVVWKGHPTARIEVRGERFVLWEPNGGIVSGLLDQPRRRARHQVSFTILGLQLTGDLVFASSGAEAVWLDARTLRSVPAGAAGAWD